MQKIIKDKIEFYITNVCNFNCDNCNRLNNYYFSGHDLWADYQEIYQKWSQVVEFKAITILGGEPTLNPTLIEWIVGLRKLWPNAVIDVVTNGTRLEYWFDRGLFNTLAETNTKLNICLHNRSRHREFLIEIQKYLINPVKKWKLDSLKHWPKAYSQVKDPSWPECKTYQDFENLPAEIKQECIDIHQIGIDDYLNNTAAVEFVDKRNICVSVSYYEDFFTAPLKYTGNNQFAVYNSNPLESHNVCISKHCTHMMKGKIYKCHHVALLPQFANQFDVLMSEDQQSLIGQYQPLTVDTHPNDLEKSLQDLKNFIPQCSLCPSKLDSIALQSTTDKPKVKKKVFQIHSLC
jgi:organic radical activating enzyme